MALSSPAPRRGLAGRPGVPAVAAVVVGFLTALQSRVNGGLSVLVGNGLEAAVVSFGSGLVILSAIVLAVRPIRTGLAGIPVAVREGRLAWWQLLGGLGGGFFVAVQSFTVPVVGVAVFTVAVVAGQSGNSLAVDRAGLGPAGPQEISPMRVVSAVLAVVAVGVAVSNRWGGAAFSVPAVVLALLAGMVIAVQQAINGRVGRATGQPVAAAWVNFSVGTTGLLVGFLLAWAFTDIDPGALPSGPWMVYAGGAIGVVFIATAAWVVGVLGVLLFSLLSIAGQLTGALVLDLVAPAPGATVSWQLVTGVLLTFAAVALAARRPS